MMAMAGNLIFQVQSRAQKGLRGDASPLLGDFFHTTPHFRKKKELF
jgi:hypothetical protein